MNDTRPSASCRISDLIKLLLGIFNNLPLIFEMGLCFVVVEQQLSLAQAFRAGDAPQLWSACKIYMIPRLRRPPGVVHLTIRSYTSFDLPNPKRSKPMRTWIPASSIVCVFFLAASNLLGQKPAFEVASVKPNNSGKDSSSSKTSQRPHGSMTDINVTLRFLILQAYELREFQVAGGPAWTYQARFDVEGKAPPIANPDLHAMMRSLLEERSQLKVHRERRALSVFLLSVAEGGSKMRSSSVGPPGGPISSRTNAGSAGGEIVASGVGIALLADTLTSEVGRPVIDKTGLTGRFDINLKWSPSASPNARAGSGGLDTVVTPRPSAVFTAIREQLGLKLEAGTAAVEMLVIDDARNPFNN
jgi:uncharacterized protein (TIGR03435 family)